MAGGKNASWEMVGCLSCGFFQPLPLGYSTGDEMICGRCVTSFVPKKKKEPKKETVPGVATDYVSSYLKFSSASGWPAFSGTWDTPVYAKITEDAAKSLASTIDTYVTAESGLTGGGGESGGGGTSGDF